MNKAEKLRELFGKDKLIRVMGAHNALSARLAQEAGFDAIWASGLEISTASCVPDANILTMSDFLNAASSMNEAVSIPVVADCDTGFGNSNNVMQMVRKYEAAGVAAVSIEDKQFPKMNSLVSGRQDLASMAEFVGKILAAKNVQKDKNFIVIARTEALIAGLGENEAFLRAEKYIGAGADAVLIHSKSDTYDEIVNFAKRWDSRAPLVIVPTKFPSIMADFSDRELLEMGIKMVIFANHGIRASIKATRKVFADIMRAGGTHTVEKKITTLEEVFGLQGMTDLKEQEKKYLKSESEDMVVVMPAAGKPVNQKSIKPLLRDRPLCMIDINGKTLLERNIETLRECKIKNINLVVGYKKEQVMAMGSLKDINILINNEFGRKGLAHSIMLAEEKMTDRTLLVYADILFSRDLIDKILKLRDDIVIVGDNTYKRYGSRNKKLDLINVRENTVTGKREFATERLLNVKAIGKKLIENDGSFEFVGLAFFSKHGIRQLRDLYHRGRRKHSSIKHFHESKNFNQVSLTDMIQEAADNGLNVKLMPVTSGWMEIHEFDDYKTACERLKQA